MAPKPKPKWDVHFGGLADDRKDSTVPRSTFGPQPGEHRQCGLAICTFHLGFSLVAIMDWHSRYVVSWRLSNTLEADFCIEALQEALGQGQPKVFNTDQSLPRRRPGAASSPGEDQAWMGRDERGAYGTGDLTGPRAIARRKR